MRIRGYASLIIGIIIFSNCGTSNKFVVGSNYDPSFNPQKMDNMAVVFHYVDETDETFWKHKSSKDKTPAGMEQELFDDMLNIFRSANINIRDHRIDSSSTARDELKKESKAIRQFLTDLNNAGSLTFSFQSSYDYKSLLQDDSSQYAIVIITDPYSVENTHTSGGGFAADGSMMPSVSSSNTTYEYGVFSYIVDLETNKVVWVFNNFEYVDLYTFDYSIPQASALAALMIGRDLEFSSFELETENEVLITEYSGEEFLGRIIELDGHTIKIQTSDSTFNRHLRAIKEIKTQRINSYGESVGRTLYPQYLK